LAGRRRREPLERMSAGESRRFFQERRDCTRGDVQIGLLTEAEGYSTMPDE
jgi:hypothetical protein